jgi:hypothetical protein
MFPRTLNPGIPLPRVLHHRLAADRQAAWAYGVILFPDLAFVPELAIWYEGLHADQLTVTRRVLRHQPLVQRGNDTLTRDHRFIKA